MKAFANLRGLEPAIVRRLTKSFPNYVGCTARDVDSHKRDAYVTHYPDIFFDVRTRPHTFLRFSFSDSIDIYPPERFSNIIYIRISLTETDPDIFVGLIVSTIVSRDAFDEIIISIINIR